MAKKPEWQLAFVLPNLRLEEHHLSPTELNLELDGISIVPASDERVEVLMEWSEPAARFIGSFHDGNGTPITPSTLIVREDWLRDMNRSAEPIISFRNAVAMSSILPARAQTEGGGWLGAYWSDVFDYHSAQLRPDGSGFDLWTPALNSIGFKLKGLSLTPDIRLPRSHLGPIDEHLAVRLGRVWKKRYRSGETDRASAKVFRSMEAAYEAAAIKFRNYSSLQEVGLGAVDWATAVEVLASPKKGNVNKWDCTKLIGRARKAREKELWHRKYRARRRNRKGEKGLRYHALNLAQKTFIYLHNARSKFVHGDDVSAELLAPFGDDAPPLLSLASTIYRIALVAFLELHWPWPMDAEDLRSLDLVPGMRYRRHLMAAVTD